MYTITRRLVPGAFGFIVARMEAESSDECHTLSLVYNEWQSYRTRQDPTLQKRIAHTYDEPGEYTIVVKAIDILGNDTTKSLKVQVK